MVAITAREQFLDACDKGDVAGAIRALEELAPARAIDDQILLELLVLAETPARKPREKLERILTSVVIDRGRRGGDDRDELFWMTLDRWRDSGAFDAQIASDVMASILRRHPESARALSTWIIAALRDELYLHRGVDLQAIATVTAQPALAARLLATDALIRCVADGGSTERARLLLARACALDPEVDVESLREECLDAMGLHEDGPEEERSSALPPIGRW